MDGKQLRVALIGTAFMGRAHSHAWRTAPRFFDLPLAPQVTVLVGSDPARTEAAAAQYGIPEWSTTWQDVVSRDDIDVVDICTPGNLHHANAIAALAAGKHVLCEKPLANSVAEADEMAAAARAAAANGVVAFCGFSYRRTPALALARQLVAEGRLGTIRHVRAQYLQDWLSDPAAPWSWRLDSNLAGSGALGDIGAHSIDTAQWLTGSLVTDVSALTRTFVHERPTAGSATAPVTVDDAAAFTATFDSGAIGVFEATRMALGRKNANRIELNGDKGSLAFDFERMNELELFEDDGSTSGFRRIQATEASHPYVGAWWPVGHGLGYEHSFTHEVVDLVNAIATGQPISPSFDDAAQVQHVLDAVSRSAANNSIRTSVKEN